MHKELYKNFCKHYDKNFTPLKDECVAIWYYIGVIDSNQDNFDLDYELSQHLHNHYFSLEQLEYVKMWYHLGVSDNDTIYLKTITQNDADAFLLYVRNHGVK